jgi:hypothetical protein
MTRPAIWPIADFISSCAAEEDATMNLARIFVPAAILTTLLSAPAIAIDPPSATAVVDSNGTLVRGIAVTGASHIDTGIYTVTFNNADVPSACAWTASIGSPGLSSPSIDPRPNLVNVGATDTAGTISVRTYSAATGQLADLPFQVYVAC